MSAVGGSAKVMPQLADAGSTKVLNLTVLQRIDPFVEEILMTAAHVTFYEFNIDRSEWSRKDVEGSLFVVKRNSQPRFQFIVMNRRNTENLVEDLLGDFEYEVQVPYLLYKNANQEVNGIWFYNPQDCEAVGNLFSRILNAFSKVPPKTKVSPNQRSGFEELEAIPTTSVIEGPLEPQASSSPVRPDATDDSFVHFFSSGAKIGNAAVAGQPHQSSTTISSQVPNVVPSALPTLQPAPPLTTSTPLVPLIDPNESAINSKNHSTNLLKPSFFGPPASSSSLMMPPVSSSSLPTAPPLHPPVTMRHYGLPLLQPFPPPTPSPSLTPTPNYSHVLTKEKLRDALLRLVQNDNFIDMVYREMLNAHYS